jgi:hypothetical protein
MCKGAPKIAAKQIENRQRCCKYIYKHPAAFGRWGTASLQPAQYLHPYNNRLASKLMHLNTLSGSFLRLSVMMNITTLTSAAIHPEVGANHSDVSK